MNIFISFTISLVLLSSFCFGQDTHSLKRTPYKLVVAVDKKTAYEEQIKATDYVLPDRTIQLYPGETVFIEIEQTNGVISKMTAVAGNDHPEKTVTISFTQTAKNKVHELMVLKIENPFPKNLQYKSKIFLLKHNRWVDTNVYPVRSKLSAFETWPDIITSIALGDWSFQD